MLQVEGAYTSPSTSILETCFLMNLVFGLVVLCLMSINSLVCFMGRYVAIGLMTGLYFKKREAEKVFDSS